jgi:hypothetical protein
MRFKTMGMAIRGGRFGVALGVGVRGVLVVMMKGVLVGSSPSGVSVGSKVGTVGEGNGAALQSLLMASTWMLSIVAPW